jgi:hypothetical protein
MDFLRELRWSPYVAGAGIGVLSWFAFLFLNKPLGCSTAFAGTGGMIRTLLRGKGKTETNAYYRKFPPVIDWEWMFWVFSQVPLSPHFFQDPFISN